MTHQKFPPDNIVKVIEYEGGGITYICSDAFAKTPEEELEVRKNISQSCWNIVEDARARGEEI